jgi:hypothetical protein
MDQDDPEKRIAELERLAAEQMHNAALKREAQRAQPAAHGQNVPMPPPPPWPGAPPTSSTPHTGQPTGLSSAGAYAHRVGSGSLPNYAAQYGRRSRAHSWRGLVLWVVIILVGMAVSFARHNHGSPSHDSSGSTNTPVETVSNGGNIGFTGSNQTETIECDYGDISVTGEQNTINVVGHCGTIRVGGKHNAVNARSAYTVTLDGSSDKVFIDSVDTINAGGDSNTVVFHSGSPHIANTGTANDIHLS